MSTACTLAKSGYPSILITQEQNKRITTTALKYNLKTFSIAKDRGSVYVCIGPPGNDQCIFYFEGTDPVVHPKTHWENSTYMFGGDDFGFEQDISNLGSGVGKVAPSVRITLHNDYVSYCQH